MLELKGIRKEYPAGDGKVEALKGIDLQFRKSEFVSILGPSGCGKTTMLNIIGGLDGYTEGDLVINGTSTKEYKDRDWDSYRNHSVGFVFQSYNLIPHQTVLQNVELALTLSGVSKAERKERAKKALEEVGLGDQLYKRPNAMSGGQMQRVAIARALVNNPDIILADEPTGALDTETSVQVMEILKDISKDRLIVMVTHNPELAEQYSSRIICMLDGRIIDDSQPITEDEKKAMDAEYDKQKKEAKKKVKKPSMSFATSFMLSLKNLFSKKGRTTLTAFAGSIGIIGIALILSVSQGMTTYIDAVQEDTLSSYPLTLEATTIELSTLMETFMNLTAESTEHDKDAVYKKSALYNMMNAFNNLEQQENDLKSFKVFLEAEVKKTDSKLAEAINGISYTYDLGLNVYTKNVEGVIIPSDTEKILYELILKYMNIDMAGMHSSMESMGIMGNMTTSMSTMKVKLFQEMLTGLDGDPINALLKEQYDVIYGTWPNSYDEIVLVVDENNELDDITLYALGLLPEEKIEELMDAAMNGTELKVEEHKWTFEEICNMEFKTVVNADCYAYDEATGLYMDLRQTEAGLRYLYDNALTLKVTGIIRPNEDATATMLTGNIGYTRMLTEYLIEKADGTPVIEAQFANPTKDVITGLPFNATTGTLTNEEKEKAFREYIAGLTDDEKAAAYIAISSIPPVEVVKQQVDAILGSMTRADIEAQMAQAMSQQMSVSAEEIAAYLANMSDEEINSLMTNAISDQVKAQYATEVAKKMATMSKVQLAGALTMAMETYTIEQCATYYDEVLEFSESTFEDNLIAMGYIDIESPATINIYASSFENKDIITAAISDYNKSVDEIKEIKYTDYVGLMMSSITTIIDAITYVLIAFVSISLVVSSIMIGVITLISVQERTKEIGILRAIGASKKNVSRMFNAETMIVGFSAGLLGVVVTYLLCIPINLILHEITGIGNLSAIFPWEAALILVAISVVLTLISGIIPSRSAAKKDPVVALRTE